MLCVFVRRANLVHVVHADVETCETLHIARAEPRNEDYLRSVAITLDHRMLLALEA